MIRFLTCLVLISVLPVNSAFAQTTAFIPLGSRPGTNSGILSLSTGNSFETVVAKDHSAYCRYRAETLSTDINFSTTVTCSFGSCVSVTGTLVGAVNGGFDFSPSTNDAISYTALGTGNHRVTLSLVTPNPSNITLECFDTTLFGNFNTVTVANPFNFLEITNDTDTAANALVVVTNNAGTELSRSTVTLSAKQQRDISIHDIAGAANTFGSILVSHNSIPNGIRASLTKYTSSFAITASTPLTASPNAL